MRLKSKNPPIGFSDIEGKLEEYEAQMRAAETDAATMSKKRNERFWPITRIVHERSKYIYDLYYKKNGITKEVYDFCANEKLVDIGLVAKWKKIGYKNLCCVKCAQSVGNNFNAKCICRVPNSSHIIECFNCGCTGCADADIENDDDDDEEEDNDNDNNNNNNNNNDDDGKEEVAEDKAKSKKLKQSSDDQK